MSSNISQSVIDKIFSHDVFKGVDRDGLVKRYDVAGSLREIKAPLRGLQRQVQQTGNIIASIPPEGIIISSPGLYTFSGDITWSPPSAAGATITIASDDVVLDLNGFTLKAMVLDNSRHMAGIYVRNAWSVIVRNGALANMCLYGICAEDCSKLLIEKITVSGLSFNNLDIRNICPAGIHIDHMDNVAVTDCAVEYMYVTCDSSAGIQLTNTSNATIGNCRVGNLVNCDGSLQGYSYIGSWNISTVHCTAADFQADFKSNLQTLGHTVLGFVPIFCSELNYENCSATNMIGCCDDCHGMSVFLDTGVTATGFTANTVVVCDAHGNWNRELGYGTGFGWAPDPRVEFRTVGANLIEYADCTARNCHVGFDTWFPVDSTWTNVHTAGYVTAILVEPGVSRTLSGNPCSECNPPITVAIVNIACGNTYPPS